ncbi:hypothetical protein EGW08_014219, partial [Elysia chlorotica]
MKWQAVTMAFTRCSALLLLTAITISAVPQKDDVICVEITLKSLGGKPVSQVVVDENKVPQKVVDVSVWDQISPLKCVKGVNFFYYSTFLIVKGGCAATFKVCYKKTVVATTAAPLTTIQPGCTKVRLLSRKARPVFNHSLLSLLLPPP